MSMWSMEVVTKEDFSAPCLTFITTLGEGRRLKVGPRGLRSDIM